ncbi:MAG: hypothetical protein IJE65_05765 [Clostridia bacterium]|nr:hypothetical protein [Clostridia bacterium]
MRYFLLVLGTVLILGGVFTALAVYKWLPPDWVAQKFMKEKFSAIKNKKQQLKAIKETRFVFIFLCLTVLLFIGILLLIIGSVLTI